MGDLFANLRSGIQFPQVVMNQGPMPGTGGLPRPLHDTVDGRINYNSSLLGDLSPYAYGEPGYLSSQTSYLNVPHKLQKIVPSVYLPEAKVGAMDFFDLSHPVDDGDLAFALRLDRQSLFCTGLKSRTQRVGLGTAIDPLVNLATVNYILSGLQLGMDTTRLAEGGLWRELLCNLDKNRFGPGGKRDGKAFSFDDLLHVVRHCIRPFGVARGSERQGGQNEATASPATWPVSFVVSVTMDGKESNVMNIWHSVGLSAGEDLVLRLKPKPVLPYTLNHYYKGVKRQSWGMDSLHVWQLVPDVMHLDAPTAEEREACVVQFPPGMTAGGRNPALWQELGYWHIGRSQIMSGKYGVEEYWHNDLANDLRINHLDMTLQPVFVVPPSIKRLRRRTGALFAALPLPAVDPSHLAKKPRVGGWEPQLGLERLSSRVSAPAAPGRRVVGLVPRPAHGPVLSLNFSDSVSLPARPAPGPVAAAVDDSRWDLGLGLGAAPPPPAAVEDIGTLSFTFDEPPAQPAVQSSAGARKGGRRKGAAVGGSLLRADGTSEASMVGML
jgi:hypothetical protein